MNISLVVIVVVPNPQLSLPPGEATDFPTAYGATMLCLILVAFKTFGNIVSLGKPGFGQGFGRRYRADAGTAYGKDRRVFVSGNRYDTRDKCGINVH